MYKESEGSIKSESAFGFGKAEVEFSLTFIFHKTVVSVQQAGSQTLTMEFVARELNQ